MAPNLRGNILSLCAECEQLDEVEVVSEIARGVALLVPHELKESVEGLVVVEQQNVISSVGQLGEKGSKKRKEEKNQKNMKKKPRVMMKDVTVGGGKNDERETVNCACYRRRIRNSGCVKKECVKLANLIGL